MYRKRNREQISIDDFIPPFGGMLSAENRWVKLSKVIPWDRNEEQYAVQFGKCGNVAIPLRVALADKIYRNRTNLAYCREHGIRLSGPRLGRPGPSAQADRKIARADNAARNGIESPFGVGKSRYGLGRIMAKLRRTAESVIAMQFLLLNLDNRVRFLWRFLLLQLWHEGERVSGLIRGSFFVRLNVKMDC